MNCMLVILSSKPTLKYWLDGKNHFANLAKESDHGYLDTVDIEYKHIIKICQHDFIHEIVSKEELDKAVDKPK